MDSFWQYAILLVTGLVAGFVDTIAGGGGLITLPVLLSLGLPPQDALGTNKLQSSFGSGSATFHYAHAGVVDLQECRLGILFTLIGTSLGALTVLRIDPAFLRQLIPILLVGIISLTWPFGLIAGNLSTINKDLPFLMDITLFAGGVLLAFLAGRASDKAQAALEEVSA